MKGSVITVLLILTFGIAATLGGAIQQVESPRGQGPRGQSPALPGARGTNRGNVPVSPTPFGAPTAPTAAVKPIETAAGPPPDTTEKPGAISGVVMRGGTQEGLPGARILLVPATRASVEALPDLDDPLEAIDRNRIAHADPGGRFTFPTVKPGLYSLIAQRDGFVRQAFGQRGANAFGSVIVVASGQTVDLVLPLRPAPAIAGIIMNSTQEPLAAAIVQAHRLRYTPFGRQLQLVQTVTTNDRGEYRLFWLTPGDYFVSVTYNPESARELSAKLPENPNLSRPEDGYSGVVFPGNTYWADAQVVRVEAAEVNGINIVWKDTGRVTVRGKFQGTVENSANVKMTLLLPDGAPVPGFSQPKRSDKEGRFELHVFPGDYVLLAESNDGRAYSEVMPLHIPDRGLDDLAVPLSLGLLLGVPVYGVRGVEGVSLTLCRLGPASLGHKACYGTYTRALHGQREFESFFIPLDDFGAYLQLPGGVVQTAIGGALSFGSEVGPALAKPPLPDEGLPPDLTALGTRDVTSDLLRSKSRDEVPDEPGLSCFAGSDPPSPDAKFPNVCLLFAIAQGSGVFAGRVHNAVGDPVADAQIILVPAPPRPGARRPPNRYFTATTDATGQYEIPAVEGSYIALAFEEIEPGSWFAPDFVDRFSKRGAPAGTANGRSDSSPDLLVITREEANR